MGLTKKRGQHSTPFAGYPELVRLEQILDEKEPLEEDKVRKACAREMEKMELHKVKENMIMEEVKKRGFKVVKSRWVDTRRPYLMTHKV